MTDSRDKDGSLLPDAERLNSFGKVLRATSLDELPELFNIIQGDMAIVGPRPLLIKYLPYYREKEKERHAVRPGLTGLAQINGRNFLMWDNRLAADIKYVKHITFIGDLKIVLKTIIKVIKRSDVAIKRIPPAFIFIAPRIVLTHIIKEKASHMIPLALLYAAISEISDSFTVLPDQNHIGFLRLHA